MEYILLPLIEHIAEGMPQLSLVDEDYGQLDDLLLLPAQLGDDSAERRRGKRGRCGLRPEPRIGAPSDRQVYFRKDFSRIDRLNEQVLALVFGEGE